jgi:integrase
MRRRESPIARTNKSGRKVFVARWTGRDGKRRSAGTYPLKRQAQAAIDAAYEAEGTAPARPETFGGYFATWTQLHPRARVTDKTNESRVRAVLDVKVDGRVLRDWPFDELRWRHANALVDHMLRVQGRARTGALNIIGTLATMAKDAMRDEVIAANPFRDIEIRPNDRRIQKQIVPPRVYDWEQMHAFAAACARGTRGGAEIAAWRAVYAEPMVRVLSDCGLRAGELLALRRQDLDLRAGLLEVRQTTNLGEILPGTKTDHGEPDAGRVVPVPAALCGMLEAMPKRIDSPLLFPTPTGRLWFYAGWWRDVWVPGRKVSGMDIRPHDMRHSWVSYMRAALIDVADVAAAAGHTVETASRTYTHSLGRSFEAMREAVG